MFVLAAAFAGYFALLLHSDLTRPEPAGFISEIHDSALTLDAVAHDSPADRAGLEAGDHVVTETNLRAGHPLALEVAPRLRFFPAISVMRDERAKRSKIAGEMVPHLKMEDDASCVVTAVPDEARGERLVAFHTSTNITAEALWSRLCESELPKLWIPKRVRALALEITRAKTLSQGTV